MKKYVSLHLLEKVLSVLKREKRYGVCEHPNVSTPAIVVRFTPLAIFIRNSQYVVGITFRVTRLIPRVCVER